MHMILFSHQIAPLQCNFLQSFAVVSYVQKNQPKCQQNVSWCLANKLFGRWDVIFWQNVSQHFQHFADMTAHVGMTCHLGGLGNMTRCRHFQLSHQSAYKSKMHFVFTWTGQNCHGLHSNCLTLDNALVDLPQSLYILDQKYGLISKLSWIKQDSGMHSIYPFDLQVKMKHHEFSASALGTSLLLSHLKYFEVQI